MYENVLIKTENGIRIITINRPAQLNALNKNTISELSQALLEADKEESVGLIIITGEGEKSFVAGADIKEFADFSISEGGTLAKTGQSSLFNLIENLTKPVIAAINGFALGGGLGNVTGNQGGSGGSGGGSGYNYSAAGGLATGTNTFGNNGGAGITSYAGGGGGGATSAGQNAPSGARGGDGGQGYLLTNIDPNLTATNFAALSGMTTVCSGGGGSSNNGSAVGGIGGVGAGNGGTGSSSTTVTNPTAATSFGSGGGAAGAASSSGTVGYQGLVIIRYSI